MPSAVEVTTPPISPQRQQYAEAIARILWHCDLSDLPVMRRVTCYSIAHYTEKMMNAQKTRDDAGNK